MIETINNNCYKIPQAFKKLDTDKSPVFSTIVSILNTCFGKNYKGFRKCFLILNEKSTAFWAPTMSVGQKDSRWVNSLEDEGDTIIEKDMEGKIGFSDIAKSSKRVTFVRFVDGIRFMGVYEFDKLSSKPNYRIFRRKSKTIDLSAYCFEKEKSNFKIALEESQKLTLLELKKLAEHNSSVQVEKKMHQTMVSIRNAYVAAYAKKKAAGKCQLCGQLAPFKDMDGEPFLENHHIIWLANGGTDTIDNTVALCPNCHRRMHILNQKEDVDLLLEIAKQST